MKKIKEIWQNNKIIFVLLIILIVCFIAIISVSLSYFVGSEKSPYGNRLDNMVKISNEQKNNVIDTLKKDSLIKNATFRQSIRTIYISITFNEGINLDGAKEKAVSCLDLFSDEILKYYDVNFILSSDSSKEEEKFNIMGCRNSNGNGVYWNNNTQIVEEEE